jgi:NAD(P)-dependent dehydrogenase (short-subunit alcohol dehydrogenase family)
MQVFMPLSDVEELKYGPTQVVPGSHYAGRKPQVQDHPAFDTKGPHSFLTRQTHAYLFNNQMWHRGAPNASDRTRLMAGVTYSKRFIAQKFYPFIDYRMPEHVWEGASGDGQGMIVQADVSREREVGRMIDDVRERLGPVELLVNNAGVGASASHDEFGFTEWKRMFEVNVDGPFLTTWAVKDDMIRAGYGRIVNISSLASVMLKENMIHYATTKAAVTAFTRQCSAGLARHSIRVNCVAPGLTNTDLASEVNPDMIEGLIAATPLGRMAEPGEIASVIRFLLSDDAGFVTGQTIVACGGRS